MVVDYCCDKFLGIYGLIPTPHRGRDRLVTFLSSRARRRWNGIRHITRRGLQLVSDFRVDNTSWILYGYGCLDYYDEREVRTMVRPGDVCFDLGANTGYYSMLLSRWVGPGGRVYSYEPIPYTHSFLTRNLSNNFAANVVPVQSAVADHIGQVRMQAAPSGFLGWSKVDDSGELEVACTTIDAEVQRLNLKRLDFIKMDIQGYELRALEAAENTFRKLRPKVLFEVWPQGLQANGVTAEMLADFFRSHDYGLFVADRERLKPVSELKDTTVSYFNAFAIPAT